MTDLICLEGRQNLDETVIIIIIIIIIIIKLDWDPEVFYGRCLYIQTCHYQICLTDDWLEAA
jgi:hypothetical protein